jgi:hypothetical protein
MSDEMNQEEQPQAEPAATSEAASAWREVVSELDALGAAIGRWVNAAANDPENKRRLEELSNRLDGFVDSVGATVKGAAEGEVGQSFKEAADKTGEAFKAAGVDVIHASSGQTVKWQKPVYGRMWQTPFAEFIKHSVNIPTIAVGDITLPEQVNMIVGAARADICAHARPHLNNPFFTRQAAGHYGVRRVGGNSLGWPVQLKSGEYQLYRECEKINEKAADLAAKARPNRRHYARADA